MSAYRPLLLLFGVLTSIPALAQVQMRTSQDANYRSFHGVVPLPLPLAQSVGKLEYNLGGKASIAIEGAYSHPDERYSDKAVASTGESLHAEGRAITVLISRFSRPQTMSGFYWSLGVGYREMTAQWKALADPADPEVNFSLVDSQGYLDHQAHLSGMTGHGRLGYRYVPDWPFMFGIFLGARHFQNKVEDAVDQNGNPKGTPMTDQQKQRMKRYFMSKLEPNIELAISF